MSNFKNQLNPDDLDKLKSIADSLGLRFELHDLKKIKEKYTNAFEISKNLIYFYPSNDGYATRELEFYKDGELVISNDREYSEISNLDEIILQMVRLYSYSLDNEIVLAPYSFMLELTDEIGKDYNGRAELVANDQAIKNLILTEQNFDEAKKYFINHFLDHFICWNFGLSVSRNETLRKELEELNDKVIDMGIREYAGNAMFELKGDFETVNKGLLLYSLPAQKTKFKVE